MPCAAISIRPPTPKWLRSATRQHGSVARGFDVPTLGEKTASADPTVGFNPALQPKRVWNYEVGVKSFVTRRLFVDASVYRQAIRGELLPRQVAVGNQTVTVYDNAGRSRHWGAEVAATATVSDRVDVGASYTFADFTLLDFTGTVVGRTTSGTFSPTLKQGIALALLPPEAGVDDELSVDVRGRRLRCRVVRPPFVQVQTRQD